MCGSMPPCPACGSEETVRFNRTQWHCDSCGTTWKLDPSPLRCPKCQSAQTSTRPLGTTSMGPRLLRFCPQCDMTWIYDHAC